MRKIHKTDTARADLVEIISYISQDNPPAAYRWLQSLNAELDTLLRFPGLGRPREELRPNLRSLPFGNYMIYYAPTDDGITLIRVVHGARDIDQLLEDG